MKKLLLPLFCLVFIQSKATTWNVTVENFQFTSATLNVVIGDVIHWEWVNGTHTTTSVSVPPGAASWDSPMDATHTTFDYTVTQAGVYSYQCNFHFSFGMVASITASAVTPVTLSAFNISIQNNKPLLLWTTQTEVNADYFSVRKSTNGIDFKEIGKVAAAGNSVNKKDYSFSDGTLAPGINYVYYALATVDKDGEHNCLRSKFIKIKMHFES